MAESTLKEQHRTRDAGPPRALALTILFHSDLARVGERARLGALGGEATYAVARTEPGFVQPGGAREAPLGDPHLSRRPVRLAADEQGGVTVAFDRAGTQIVIDGVPLAEARRLSRERIEEGVVLELADRVVLLLHPVGPERRRGARLGLIGDSDAIEGVRADVQRVADLTVPVLLRGESGVGKELVARAIHEQSLRRAQPCVCVNMGAIHASVAVSELFGHVRGAFTGAVRDHKGYFAQADGGTLFLDEIGETPGEVQPMLLRVLENGEIFPMGAQLPRKVDVRLIAATDADLEHAIDEKTFRAALLHRLAGYQIAIPPLRRRPDDIGRLLVHFLREELGALHAVDRLRPRTAQEPTWLPAAVAARVARCPWPGNVRELRNFVRQLVIANREAERVVLSEALAQILDTDDDEDAPAEPPAGAHETRAPSEIGEDELRATLRANGWRHPPAARHLGIARNSLLQLMKRFGIRKPSDLSREEIARALAAGDGDVAAAAERLDVSERGLRLRMRGLGLP